MNVQMNAFCLQSVGLSIVVLPHFHVRFVSNMMVDMVYFNLRILLHYC